MHTILQPQPQLEIVYPESDGKPMADNSIQFRWIFVLAGNLAAQFDHSPNVYVCGDMFWYPVQGHPEIVQAPNVFVVFGPGKGDRASYRQWEEGGIPLTVVFEILATKNTHAVMVDKFIFYEENGVEEYYVYDPEKNRLIAYLRSGMSLVRVRQVNTYVSPRLGIRFDLSGPEMVVYGPNDKRFLTFEQLEHARKLAEQQAAQAQQQVAQARQQLARLAELSRKARRGQATAEELAELESLENQITPPGAQ